MERNHGRRVKKSLKGLTSVNGVGVGFSVETGVLLVRVGRRSWLLGLPARAFFVAVQKRGPSVGASIDAVSF